MSRFRRLLRWAFFAFTALFLLGAIGLGILYYVVSSKVPDIQSLRTVELQEPLYVYANDGRLIGLFGETRRYPVNIENVPKQVQDAFIAAEDANFRTHNGIDPKGISRALWQTATLKEGRVAGGSTITQQVARQFFLSSEYSYTRKLVEMMLAMKIEGMLTKPQILELYLNKSFFGNRAYGVAAAAEYYYGKPLDQLTLGETATLVSALKFPSSGNPISNPERNHQRSVYVIDRMLEDKLVTAAEAAAAKAEAMHAKPHERPVEVYAPYVAEMVRQEMIARFGGDVVNKGYHVTTTIDPTMQIAADVAVREGLRLYDHRHGWNGIEQHFEVTADADAASLAAHVAGIPTQNGLIPTVVARANGDGGITVVLPDASEVTLPASASRWTGKNPAALFKRGDLARIKMDAPKVAATKPGETPTAAEVAPIGYQIDQLPRGQAALVSLDASNGAVKAIIGGYSFAGNKFNRATQARRQPGSSFKPFLYAAAFERGFNPASIVLDAPVVFRDRRGHMWRPQNDGGGFRGPMRLREALVQSRNLVSVRLLDSIGVDFARKYISQFGFNEAELPPNLSMSLGTASLTPLSMARGYAVFANGGSRVTPWFIDEIKDREGNVIFKEKPATACRTCGGGSAGAPAQASNVVDGFDFSPTEDGKPKAAAETTPKKPAEAPKPVDPNMVVAPRAIDERTAYQLVSMMRDVVLRGTATAAKVLNREDVGGKTGSTNDHRDAWFGGFGGSYATVVWVGRDDFRSLGYREYGGKAALPIWIDFMREALKEQPIAQNDPPDGMVQVTSNGATEWVKAEDLDRIQSEEFYNTEENAAADEAAFDIF
ncbi:penicillin-binding protein 1A [Pseudoxanthomonas sacheonensis]|uniref:Penicillin-binding protein 1A n=1 Tax=Pseudoxanthomonas sacheonensis TaxID=443615 RepID=A0ABU1RMD1_9GAMM|nr:penicillin-binding protein 1A [Pseudoxanthomonas sacheonensis]MDR6839772.1 penicillin-binding protein 1A [Pseudoxanthomonas sacheonensis]